ncbi:MAG: ROK family protein [Elusimicrobiota bacterium]|jgi:glucokinase-like ROK family protein|nr:ROK family protein [Elusimicrobiota bacterium]
MKAIGIDIGGGSVKFAAVDAAGRVLKRFAMPTDTAQSADAFAAGLAAAVNALKADFGGKNIALGIGLPGDTDPQKGMLRWAPNIPWHNFKIKTALEAATGCRCFVSNDANMAAWGVYAEELKYKYQNLIVMTIGTGIGCGIIIGGRLYNGATGSAGEPGHAKIDFGPRAPLCGCGGRGCLEAYCGAAGIRRAALAAARKNPQSALAGLIKKEGFSAEIISAAAQAGDKTALALWRDIGLRLGRGLANMILLLNPQAVVLAGGVSRGSKYFEGAVREVFASQSVRTPFESVKLLISRRQDIGAAGAALYAAAAADEK